MIIPWLVCRENKTFLSSDPGIMLQWLWSHSDDCLTISPWMFTLWRCCHFFTLILISISLSLSIIIIAVQCILYHFFSPAGSLLFQSLWYVILLWHYWKTKTIQCSCFAVVACVSLWFHDYRMILLFWLLTHWFPKLFIKPTTPYWFEHQMQMRKWVG